MKLEFSRQIFEKYSNIKFHENPSSGSRVVPYGRTDRRTNKHDEANSHYSQFFETPKNLHKTFIYGNIFKILSVLTSVVYC